MKRVLGTSNKMSKEFAIKIIRKASEALHLVLNLPDDIEGLDLYEYFDRSDFGDMADVQEKLMWSYLEMERDNK